MSAATTHKFQAPKGTRDFYPDDLARRRYVESAWRAASVNHGFDEIDGPTFEHLELYTVKSGPGIESELFSFTRAGGDTRYALRPEFTPTLARMAAAQAAKLPKPIKWFCIPAHFRAERPQRGRLREFTQWNVDVVGDPTPRADAEVIATAIAAFMKLGLGPDDVKVKLSHRHTISQLLEELGLAVDKLPAAFDLLDRRDKISRDEFERRAATLGFDAEMQKRFRLFAERPVTRDELVARVREAGLETDVLAELGDVYEMLDRLELTDWITFDFGIVRGLAYYTGTVFEMHATSGRERAVAGGGRYDGLVEMFGGPPTPAVGFAMGDVVLSLVLEELGQLGPGADYHPRPDVFVVNGRGDTNELDRVVGRLRRVGLHVRHSSRATTNIGKLLGEASRKRSRLAVILGEELDSGQVVIKDLESGKEEKMDLATLPTSLGQRLAEKAP